MRQHSFQGRHRPLTVLLSFWTIFLFTSAIRHLFTRAWFRSGGFTSSRTALPSAHPHTTAHERKGKDALPTPRPGRSRKPSTTCSIWRRRFGSPPRNSSGSAFATRSASSPRSRFSFALSLGFAAFFLMACLVVEEEVVALAVSLPGEAAGAGGGAGGGVGGRAAASSAARRAARAAAASSSARRAASLKDAGVGAWVGRFSNRVSRRGARTTHLGPIHRERVHVHHVEPAREALVERAQRIAEVAQALDVRVQGLYVVEQLPECRLEEAEAVGRVGVDGRAGEAAERALGDATEGRALRRGHRVHRGRRGRRQRGRRRRANRDAHRRDARDRRATRCCGAEAVDARFCLRSRWLIGTNGSSPQNALSLRDRLAAPARDASLPFVTPRRPLADRFIPCVYSDWPCTLASCSPPRHSSMHSSPPPA